MYIHSERPGIRKTFERDDDVDCKAQQCRKEQQTTTS